jgi:hypothetical protein
MERDPKDTTRSTPSYQNGHDDTKEITRSTPSAQNGHHDAKYTTRWMPSKQNGHDDTKDTTRSTPSDTYNRKEIRYGVAFQSWTTHNKNQDVEERNTRLRP